MSDCFTEPNSPRISVAPMVDRTDRHFRYFARLLTKEAVLYTEMITAQAIIHGNRGRVLDFSPQEKPVALQIAGCSPEELYKAVRIAEDWDYDEINLNSGCPSDRVSGNKMGAVLMAFPELVCEMLEAIGNATHKPVTLKHRIGIEGRNVLPESFKRTLFDSYEDMVHFINTVSKTEVDRYIIHARIAVLEGLSPKENREIPPLRYEDVYRLKKDFPNLNIEINGGIKSIKEINEHLEQVDGVMIGRAAYDNSALMSKFDHVITGIKGNKITRRQVLEQMMHYGDKMEEKGFNTNNILRHTIGLFKGCEGSSLWKQMINPAVSKQGNTREIISSGLNKLPQDVLNEVISEA